MGMRISLEQSESAAQTCVDTIMKRFDGIGATASVEHHSNALKMAFVRISTPPQHWPAMAKTLRFDHGVNYCSMVTGTHFPDGGADRGWEVVYHMMRQPVVDQAPNTNTVHEATKLSGSDIPLELEIIITLPQTDEPSVPSVQKIWVGADWNEKETWDLVGIRFEGHENMHRVLNPHDSPEGFHPLQKQHKIRYHGFNEMYDDAQGFGRKPTDEDRVK
ncbi:MAG: NADH-quinone oxidoreductase subunit C [Candidatus Poseidonia sp.]|nr:NADH-quinone oxidoreductase subunit C [Poseidonia sp.]